MCAAKSQFIRVVRANLGKKPLREADFSGKMRQARQCRGVMAKKSSLAEASSWDSPPYSFRRSISPGKRPPLRVRWSRCAPPCAPIGAAPDIESVRPGENVTTHTLRLDWAKSERLGGEMQRRTHRIAPSRVRFAPLGVSADVVDCIFPGGHFYSSRPNLGSCVRRYFSASSASHFAERRFPAAVLRLRLARGLRSWGEEQRSPCGMPLAGPWICRTALRVPPRREGSGGASGVRMLYWRV